MKRFSDLVLPRVTTARATHYLSRRVDDEQTIWDDARYRSPHGSNNWPEWDSYVDQGQPTRRFEDALLMQADAAPSRQEAYLTMPYRLYTDASWHVRSVKLRLYATGRHVQRPHPLPDPLRLAPRQPGQSLHRLESPARYTRTCRR